MRITGSELKSHGKVIEKNTRMVLIQWQEKKDPRQRTFYFIATLMGEKYIKPYKIHQKHLVMYKTMIKSNK